MRVDSKMHTREWTPFHCHGLRSAGRLARLADFRSAATISKSSPRRRALNDASTMGCSRPSPSYRKWLVRNMVIHQIYPRPSVAIRRRCCSV